MPHKIMFWNIQNAWDYAVTLPEEMAAYLLIESGDYGDFLKKAADVAIWETAANSLLGATKQVDFDSDKLEKAIESWEQAPISDAHRKLAELIAQAKLEGRLDERIESAEKHAEILCYDKIQGQVIKSRRDWILDIIRKCPPDTGPPDVLVIVEPATTKSQLEFCMAHQPGHIGSVRDIVQTVGGMWVCNQLIVSLGATWEGWYSPINATCATIQNKAVQSKNTFFELYVVLWNNTTSRLVHPGGFLPGQYPERAPCWVTMGTQQGNYNLVFTHAVYGVVPERRDTLRVLAQDLSVPKFRNEPTLVMGDFNLNYSAKGKDRELYDGLNMGESLVGGALTSFTTTRNGKAGAYLKNAYDQVFRHAFPHGSVVAGGAYDFAEQIFNYDAADKQWRPAKNTPNPFEHVRKVSDHIPVWCTIEFPPPPQQMAPIHQQFNQVAQGPPQTAPTGGF